MIARLRFALSPQMPYETRWPFRTYAVRSGERVCGRAHRTLRGHCPRCRAAL